MPFEPLIEGDDVVMGDRDALRHRRHFMAHQVGHRPDRAQTTGARRNDGDHGATAMAALQVQEMGIIPFSDDLSFERVVLGVTQRTGAQDL